MTMSLAEQIKRSLIDAEGTRDQLTQDRREIEERIEFNSGRVETLKMVQKMLERHGTEAV